MFGNRKKKFRTPKITTVIGSGTEIRGDISFSDGLHVDGVIRGDVISNPEDPFATLTLSHSGTIDGNVHVGNVMLNGTVVGDVVAANRVELASRAKIKGTLTYAMLEMISGAEINGELIHVNDQDSVQNVSDKNNVVESERDQPQVKPTTMID
jgi:cytoskeletal protein CcmA (bactofilin family)